MEVKLPQRKRGKSEKQPLLNREISFSFNLGGALKFKTNFYKELALLTSAGITLNEALHTVLQLEKGKNHQSRIKKLSDSVMQGEQLSSAMNALKFFSSQEINAIRVGERAGNLDEVFLQLAEFYKIRSKQIRNVLSTLTYPAVVVLTSVATISFMLKFLVPVFHETFKRNGTPLPRLTQMIVQLSNNFSLIFCAVVLISLTVMAVHRYLSRNSQEYNYQFSRFLIRIPLIGPFILKNQLLSCSISFQLLLSSGLTLSEALKSVIASVEFLPLKRNLAKTQIQLEKGQTFFQGLKEGGLFDPRMLSMIKIGEQSNQMALVFKSIAESLEEEQATRSKQLGSLMEPLLIVVLGGIVGLILVGMYLPMLQLYKI